MGTGAPVLIRDHAPLIPTEKGDDTSMTTKKAQRLQRRREARAAQILLLNTTPLDEITESDLRALRVGNRDEFSDVALPDLELAADEATLAMVVEALPDPRQRASALRWARRGLLVDRAIRKVVSDVQRAGEEA